MKPNAIMEKSSILIIYYRATAGSSGPKSRIYINIHRVRVYLNELSKTSRAFADTALKLWTVRE